MNQRVCKPHLTHTHTSLALVDLLMLARSKLDRDAVLKECLNQSIDDFICEIDLYYKLDLLKTSYGLETSIYDRISKIAQDQMEK